VKKRKERIKGEDEKKKEEEKKQRGEIHVVGSRA
jgi:hypothetical protein